MVDLLWHLNEMLKAVASLQVNSGRVSGEATVSEKTAEEIRGKI